MPEQNELGLPWAIEQSRLIPDDWIVYDVDGMRITNRTIEAIALLVGAAPALLAACKDEVSQLANLAAAVDPELTTQLMEGVYAAVTKATPT